MDNPLTDFCNIQVRINNSLHAKLFLFDDTEAIVTSSNLTYSAFWRNLEVALATSQPEIVREASSFFAAAFAVATSLERGMIESVYLDMSRMTFPVKEISTQSTAVQDADSFEPDDEQDLQSVDADALANVEAKIEEVQAKELREAKCSMSKTSSARVEVRNELLERFRAGVLAVFGEPVPDDDQALAVMGHESALSPQVKDDPQRCAWQEIGNHAYELAIVQILLSLKPRASGDAVNSLRGVIHSSGYLAQRMRAIGLGQFLVEDTITDETSLARIAEDAAYRLLGFMFQHRPWAVFVNRLQSILSLQEDFPYESYRDHLYKSVLQRAAQERNLGTIRYVISDRAGPEHNVVFEVQATLTNGRIVGRGSGRRLKTAETAAAFDALRTVGGPQNAWAVDVPAGTQISMALQDLCLVEGRSVARKVLGHDIPDHLLPDVMLPIRSVTGSLPTRTRLAVLGGHARAVLAMVHAFKGAKNSADATRWVSRFNANKEVAARLTVTPLGAWLRALASSGEFPEADNRKAIVETFNALLGGLVISHGLDACEAVSNVVFGDLPREAADRPARSHLIQLVQETLAGKKGNVIDFVFTPLHSLKESHDPRFKSVVLIRGTVLGEGIAARKKDAAEIACKQALVNPRLEQVLVELGKVDGQDAAQTM